MSNITLDSKLLLCPASKDTTHVSFSSPCTISCHSLTLRLQVSSGKMEFPELWLLILLLHTVALGKRELPLHEGCFCKGNTFLAAEHVSACLSYALMKKVTS